MSPAKPAHGWFWVLPLVSLAEFLAVIATGFVFVDVVLRDGAPLRRPAGPRRPVDSAAQ